MKIFFIDKKLRTDKLGFLYLSAVLKKAGHEVDYYQDDIDPVEDLVRLYKPDFIMYSVQTGEHKWYIEKNKNLKLKFNFISVFGGPHFTFYGDNNLIDGNIDYIIQGPGEDIVLDIVNNKIEKGFYRADLLKDLNDYPAPDRSILYKYNEFGQAKMKRFITMRDCPNSCTYCFNHIYHRIYNDQKKCFFTRKSPRSMIQEILDVKKQYPLEMVYFNDDDLCVDKKWLNEFLLLYTLEVRLPFCGSVRANNVDPLILSFMKSAGCHFLNMAVESAVPETQKLIRRGNISNEQIMKACNDAKELGIKIRLQNIIGLPVDEPLEDALETLRFNQGINPYDSWCSILQPFPNTDIYKTCLTKNLIDENIDLMNFYEETQLKIKNKDEINTLHKWWFFAVKYKIDIDFLRIILKQSINKDIAKEIQDYRWNITAKDVYKL